jgi:hypothetical protein
MKARIPDAEKTFIVRQRLGKHVSAVTNNHAITEELLEAVFSMQSLPRLYKKNQMEFSVSRVCDLPSWVSCDTVASQRGQEPLNTEAEL